MRELLDFNLLQTGRWVLEHRSGTGFIRSKVNLDILLYNISTKLHAILVVRQFHWAWRLCWKYIVVYR